MDFSSQLAAVTHNPVSVNFISKINHIQSSYIVVLLYIFLGLVLIQEGLDLCRYSFKRSDHTLHLLHLLCEK